MAHKITVQDVANKLEYIHIHGGVSRITKLNIHLRYHPFHQSYSVVEYDGLGGTKTSIFYKMRMAIKFFNELIGEDND